MKQTNSKKKLSSKKESESAARLGIAWYRRDEWSRLLEISADREEWLQNAETRLREMAEAGIDAVRIHISADELQDWCILQGCPVDGSARAFFTAEKLRQLDQGKTKML